MSFFLAARLSLVFPLQTHCTTQPPLTEHATTDTRQQHTRTRNTFAPRQKPGSITVDPSCHSNSGSLLNLTTQKNTLGLSHPRNHRPITPTSFAHQLLQDAPPTEHNQSGRLLSSSSSSSSSSSIAPPPSGRPSTPCYPMAKLSSHNTAHQGSEQPHQTPATTTPKNGSSATIKTKNRIFVDPKGQPLQICVSKTVPDRESVESRIRVRVQPPSVFIQGNSLNRTHRGCRPPLCIDTKSDSFYCNRNMEVSRPTMRARLPSSWEHQDELHRRSCSQWIGWTIV